MKGSITFLLLLLLAITLRSQDFDLESFIERNFDLQDQLINYEDIYESLFINYTKPLNLNSAGKNQLANLYLLTPTQIESLVTYRDQHGPLVDLHELQIIDGFDPELIRKIKPFVSVASSLNDVFSMNNMIRNTSKNYLIIRNTRRMQESRGFSENKFAGNPDHLYARLKISDPNDFSLGFTIEKDAGEKLTWSNKVRGFDHTSFHLQVQDKGRLGNVILGDYQIQFGQGLVYGAGFTPGKGAETILTSRRGNSGLRPFASVIESGYFRGLATTFRTGQSELMLFGSSILQDGNRINDTTYSDFDEFVNSIQNTGLHRTEAEIAAKNNIRESNLGYNYLFKPSKSFEIGHTMLYSIFDTPIQRRPNKYNQLEFVGTKNLLGSFYLNFNIQNLLFFAEIAKSHRSGMATIGGMIATLTDDLDVSILARNYEPNFHSFYGNAFSENSRIINEKGIYWGLSYQPSSKHQFNSYYDRFFFPWLKYQVDAPSDGDEWLFRYTFSPDRDRSLYAQIRRERKEISISTKGENLTSLQNRIRTQIIINYSAKVNSWLSTKTRLQGSSQLLNKSNTHGLVLLQDFQFNFRKWKVSSRFAVFETDDFDNRQYVFEKNVLYAFSMPTYNGQGSRKYILLEYKMNGKMTLYARYARFDYVNIDSVGSGLNETKGNVRSEWNLQIRTKF